MTPAAAVCFFCFIHSIVRYPLLRCVHFIHIDTDRYTSIDCKFTRTFFTSFPLFWLLLTSSQHLLIVTAYALYFDCLSPPCVSKLLYFSCHVLRVSVRPQLQAHVSSHQPPTPAEAEATSDTVPIVAIDDQSKSQPHI